MRNVTGSTKIAAAILAAAAIIALALFLRPEAGRYRFESTGKELQRFDTATGEVRYCRKEDSQCFSVDLDRAALK